MTSEVEKVSRRTPPLRDKTPTPVPWRPGGWQWGFVLAVILSAVCGGAAVYASKDLSKALRTVDDTNRTISRINSVMSRLKDAETGQRGYLLTGDPLYLEPYRAGVPAVRTGLAGFADLGLTGERAALVARFEDLVRRKLNEMQEVLDIRERSGVDAAVARIREARGRVLMDEVRVVADALCGTETGLLKLKTDRLARAEWASFIFAVATVAVTGSLGGLSLIVNRQFRARESALGREMTDRVSAQTAQRISEARLATAIRNAPLIVYQTDAEGRYVWIENVHPDFRGEDVIGKTDAELVGRDEMSDVVGAKRSVLATGVGTRLTASFRDVTYDVTIEPLKDDDGRVTGLTVAAFDVTAVMKTQNALAESEAFARGIFENSADAIIVLDTDGRVISVSTSGLARFGFASPDEVVGLPWGRLWPGCEADAEASFVSARDDGGRCAFRGRRVIPSGSTWWDVVTVRVSWNDGASVSVVASARDVTDQKRAEEQRDRLLASERVARSEAERAARLKDEFVATISHELRTPLNAILGWSQMLLRDPSAEVLRDGLEVVHRNARHQAKMIDDLLDMSRVLSGKLRLDVQRVDMAALVFSSLDSVRASADQAGVTLVSRAPAGQLFVAADPERFRQIVWNLVSNAIKFTPAGGRVVITVEGDAKNVRLIVSDSGKGISPGFLPYVFDRFRQEDGSPTRRYGGLGLGLSITKTLVELHEGSIRAESGGPGTGTTFTVMVPRLTTRAAADPFVLPAAADVPGLTGVRVFVVDDEPDALGFVRALLESHGAAVTTAASVPEAMSLLEGGYAPDVILSDIGMPGEDGYDFIRKVRSLGVPARDVPAAALTALARPEDRRTALACGFQEHVSKPVDPNDLVKIVDGLRNKTPVGEGVYGA